MKDFIEKLKAAIIAESYEDRAGRSVISVKSALDIAERLAAEQPDPLENIIDELELLQDIYSHDRETIQLCIDIVKGGLK